MTPDQQLRCLGISAESYDGHVIVRSDRTFMMLTPREIEVFHGHLAKSYREAMTARRASQPEPTGVLA